MPSSQFLKQYQTVVVPALQATLKYHNSLQVPRVRQVVINAGVGRQSKEPGFIEAVERILTKIAGQKPVRTKARQSISNFKIRAGQEVGVMVTLRGRQMYDFLEKLVKVTLPRVRDFHGLSTRGFDRRGNYTIGFREHAAFPEVTLSDLDKLLGLQITIQTTARDPASGQALLSALGFPFSKR